MYRPDSSYVGQSQSLYRLSYILKDISFSDEAEWRLISKKNSYEKDVIKYRSRNDLLIPFIEFKNLDYSRQSEEKNQSYFSNIKLNFNEKNLLNEQSNYKALEFSDVSLESTKVNQDVWNVKRLPLKRIVVGPSRFGNLAEQSMNGFLQSLGWQDQDYVIEQTQSPYRVL